MEEYAAAARHYSSISTELGQSFYQEIERVIGNVRRHPDRYLNFQPPARRALANRFPYSVVYLDEPDQVWILAVMHAKREPAYWRERLGSGSAPE